MDSPEICPPPRVASLAHRYNLRAGFALDLTVIDEDDGEPWNFDDDAIQAKALRRIDEQDPRLLLVSPECGPICSLQGWNHPRTSEEAIHEQAGRGLRHLSFSILLC